MRPSGPTVCNMLCGSVFALGHGFDHRCGNWQCTVPHSCRVPCSLPWRLYISFPVCLLALCMLRKTLTWIMPCRLSLCSQRPPQERLSLFSFLTVERGFSLHSEAVCSASSKHGDPRQQLVQKKKQ